MHLGRGAVDFVGQHQVGKNGAAPGGESAGLRIIHLRADQVGREQVRGELEAGELDVEGRSQGLDGEGLGQARDAFQQHVAIGQEADDQPFDQIILADDHLANFAKKRTHKSAGPLHLFVNCADTSVHSQKTTYAQKTIEEQTLFRKNLGGAD